MATIKSHKSRIVRAMKAAGIYSPNLNIQIDNLALSLWMRDKCQDVVSSEDFEMIVMKTTRDGEQPIENPILKELNRRIDDVSRQMRQLKLTVEDLIGKPDIPSPIDELDTLINSKG